MRKFIVLTLLFGIHASYSQVGKIYLNNTVAKSCEKDLFIYEPPKKLSIPENIFVYIVYGESPTKYISLPLKRVGQKYEFRLKVPDSILIMYAEIQDIKRRIIDNNTENGYVVIFKENRKAVKEKYRLEQLKLESTAIYAFALKTPLTELQQQFESLYKDYPYLKEDKSYSYYLNIKSRIEPEKTKPELLLYAQNLEKSGSERNLMDAALIYHNLKMNEKYEQLQQAAILKFPTGEAAKIKFWRAIYSIPDFTEKSMLDSMHSYINKFGDSTADVKSQFYFFIVRKYLKTKDTANLNKYVSLINNKNQIASLYNNEAWRLASDDLTKEEQDLNYAEYLAHKAVMISKHTLLHPEENYDIRQLQGTYNNYSDTYAYILFKQKKYTLAFQYEDPIDKQDELDTGGKERYAAIAEKVKGLEFTRKYIESKLLSGVDSKTLMDQLQNIYLRLKLPANQFEKLKEESTKLAEKKNSETISKIYGSTNEIDFTLTNLDSNKVTLSNYKGQVVVLDFWATWCGPCKASFPGMKKVVEKYKEKNVKFFFVNTGENDEETKVRENVRKYMKDNNYDFDVLFDLTNKVYLDYKVNGIPSKIVIDKNGMIINTSVGSGTEGKLADVIDPLLK